MKSWSSFLVPEAPGNWHINIHIIRVSQPQFHYDLFLAISVETSFILPLHVRMHITTVNSIEKLTV